MIIKKEVGVIAIFKEVTIREKRGLGFNNFSHRTCVCQGMRRQPRFYQHVYLVSFTYTLFTYMFLSVN